VAASQSTSTNTTNITTNATQAHVPPEQLERVRRTLLRLLEVPGPSSFEAAAARAWRDEAATFAEQADIDVHGSAFAGIHLRGAPCVLLTGHLDEIGLMLTHVDNEGYCYFSTIGGWDPQVLVGQRVSILGRHGPVAGVIGRQATHLLESNERDRAVKIKDLWIDIGATSREQALAYVRPGDPVVLAAPPLELRDGRLAGRGLDNRTGAVVVLEALRLLAEHPGSLRAAVWAAANAQEEITGGGARAITYRLEPQVAVVVDVTHATDYPGADRRRLGEHALGSGPAIGRGSAAGPRVFQLLVEAAEAEGIPYTIEPTPGRTGTDAENVFAIRSGVATGLVSVPLRYMHSPNEVVQLSDMVHAARLLAAFCRRLSPDTDLRPV